MAIALSPRRRFALLVAALIVTVTVVLAATSIAGDDDTTAANAATVVKDAHFIDADEPGVLTFENGDCFRDPAKNRAAGEEVLNTVECVGADNEVFTFLTLREASWDAQAVEREGVAGCERQFRTLWGERGSGPARLDVYPVLPSERSWTQDGDRNAMCVVYSHLGEFTVDPITQGVAG
jgi:hypothetical protein